MNTQADIDATGPFEARYIAFLETISPLRPALHRYCARMTGSVLDGEDVMQEALFEAYRHLARFEEGRPLRPWLFQIAQGPAAHGRTATSSASTPGCATSCWRGKSSIR